MIAAFAGLPSFFRRQATAGGLARAGRVIPCLLVGTVLAGCPSRRPPEVPMDGPFPGGGTGQDWEPWSEELALTGSASPGLEPTDGEPADGESAGEPVDAEEPGIALRGPSERPAGPSPVVAAPRIADSVAAILADPGSPVRLRFFLPAPERSEHPEFDVALESVAAAMTGACPRLARVDVSKGPFDENTVTSMRGTGVLPRTGGDPDATRAVLVAIGEEFTVVRDLAASRGDPSMQVLLALHRIVRGPVRIGVVASGSMAAAVDRLADVLPNFELSPIVAPDASPLAFGAVAVVAAGDGPLPPGTEALARRQLAAGRGVVVIGSPLLVREGSAGMEAVRSPSDPSAVLASAGLGFDPGIVMDPDCARVSVPASFGRMFLSYPPMVRTRVTVPGGAGDAIAVLPFASPVRTAGVRGAAEILAESSSSSWVETGTVDLDPSRDWRPAGATASRPMILAVSLPAEPDVAAGGRFVVIPTARIVEPETAALEANRIVLGMLVAWAARVDDLFRIGLAASEVESP